MLFKLPGKIVDGAITKPVRNLGKIHVIISDHLLGGINFHVDKVINNTAVIKAEKQPGELRTANQIVPANLLNGKGLVQVLFQIALDTDTNFLFGFRAVKGDLAWAWIGRGGQEAGRRIRGNGTGSGGKGPITPVQAN